MRNTIKVVAASTVLTLGFLGSAGLAEATSGKKVTICHATASQANPYVKISVSKSAIDGHGHDDHSHHAKDIIPPVRGVTHGKNWTSEGQAIYKNGCKVPKPTTTTTAPTTTTTKPTPTTEAPPTTTPTPTTAPTTTEGPTTTVDGVTTTVPAELGEGVVVVRQPDAAVPVTASPVYTG